MRAATTQTGSLIFYAGRNTPQRNEISLSDIDPNHPLDKVKVKYRETGYYYHENARGLVKRTLAMLAGEGVTTLGEFVKFARTSGNRDKIKSSSNRCTTEMDLIKKLVKKQMDAWPEGWDAGDYTAPLYITLNPPISTVRITDPDIDSSMITSQVKKALSDYIMEAIAGDAKAIITKALKAEHEAKILAVQRELESVKKKLSTLETMTGVGEL